jgi:hypothetical protein
MCSWRCRREVRRSRERSTAVFSKSPRSLNLSDLAKRGGCWFGRGDLKIHLGVETEFCAARKAHPALLVVNLQVLVGRLRSAGHDVREDEPLEGYHRVYVDDPFGNRIELMEPTASHHRVFESR